MARISRTYATHLKFVMSLRFLPVMMLSSKRSKVSSQKAALSALFVRLTLPISHAVSLISSMVGRKKKALRAWDMCCLQMAKGKGQLRNLFLKPRKPRLRRFQAARMAMQSSSSVTKNSPPRNSQVLRVMRFVMLCQKAIAPRVSRMSINSAGLSISQCMNLMKHSKKLISHITPSLCRKVAWMIWRRKSQPISMHGNMIVCVTALSWLLVRSEITNQKSWKRHSALLDTIKTCWKRNLAACSMPCATVHLRMVD